MTVPARLYSKSSVYVDTKCKRRLFHAYENEGGLQARSQGLELFLGSALHDGLAVIAAGTVPITDICNTAYQQVFQPMMEAATNPTTGVVDPDDIDYAKEQATLVEGILYGFYKHVWPKLMTEYTIFLVEQPMVYLHDGVGMMVKTDIILQSKADDTLWYLEYKSTSSKDDRWTRSWETNVQLHSSIRAVEQKHKVEVIGVIVQGLYKGFESYGKQSSPFCYAYKKNGAPPFTQDQYSYKYLAGFKRTPTWELEGGVRGWVDQMPEEVLADQFPQTPPIFINNDLIDAFFRQQAIRQHEIADGMKEFKLADPLTKRMILDRVFPQNFEECTPAWGSECPYRILCHGPEGQDPFQLGFTKRDTTHLEPFLEVLKEQNVTVEG